jgi:hypothetical protein
MPPKFLHSVDLCVVVASTLALEVVMVIAMLIFVVTLIMIVIMVVPNVTVTSKVIALWRVWCFVDALIQQLLGVVGIRILFSGGEEVDHRYRPFTKELVPEIIVAAQTSNEGFNSLVVSDPRNPNAHIRESSNVLAQWFIPGIADAL